MEQIENNLPEVVATEDAAQHAGLAELDRRVRELEAAMGELRSVKAEAHSAAGRKTVPADGVSLLAKGETGGAPGVDDALRSLSVEQRIAVKSGLLRAGLLR